jgi:hypothetical protein
MFRIATLLPAFTLAVALATTDVAMAAHTASHAAHAASQTASKDQGPDKQHDKSSAYASTCSDRSMYQSPSYCQPHGNKR